MLTHMQLSSTVYDILVVHTISQYIHHTVAMLHSAQTGGVGILGIPSTLTPYYIHMFKEEDEVEVVQNEDVYRVNKEVIEENKEVYDENKEVHGENKEVLNLISIRRELCSRTDRIFNQNDTINDWNIFIRNAITTLQ